MECANCGQHIERATAWKGSTDKLYCTSFCADTEYEDRAVSPAIENDRQEAA